MTTQPTPGGCQHCGIPERDHMTRWTPGAGRHKWTAPSQNQVKARMQARSSYATCAECKHAYRPEPHNTTGFCSWTCFDAEERPGAPEALAVFLGPDVTFRRIDTSPQA